jgi:hypothetical protein
MADEGDKAAEGDNLGADKAIDKGSVDWKSDLPESLKSSKTLAKFKEKSALAQSYIELEDKLGKSIALPGQDAKPEELEKFYSRIGRPEKKDDYKLDPTEGFEAPEEYLNSMKSLYHEAGLTQVQANTVHKKIALAAASSIAEMEKLQEANMKKSAETLKLKREKADEELHSTWGLNYDLRIEQARRFIINEGGDEAFNHFETEGYTDDPMFLKIMARAGSSILPHSLVFGKPVKEKPGSRYDYMRKELGVS